MDAAIISICGHALSELVLAFNMSRINVLIMSEMRKQATKMVGTNTNNAQNFQLISDYAASSSLSSYYNSWSRAQLNNQEYAPMLCILIFLLKYKADQEKKELSWSEKMASLGSLAFSYLFIYAVGNQYKSQMDLKNLAPGRGGMSVMRPLGATGRYATMGWLIYLVGRKYFS